MNPSILEKYKDHVPAFFAGAVAFTIATWFVSDNFRTREVAVLEREKAELQHRLSEAEAALKQLGNAVAVTASSKNLTADGRKELDTLIRTIDIEIASKKDELIRYAGSRVNDPPTESYKRIEEELRSLQEQRDQARRRLIQTIVE